MAKFQKLALCNTAWAFAMVGHTDALLFAALALAAQRCMDGYAVHTSENLVKTAWAFAKVGLNDASMFAALATAANWRMGDVKREELARTTRTFADKDASLLTALVTAAQGHIGDAQDLETMTETQNISDPTALTRQIKKVDKIQALLHTYHHYAS